MGEAPFIILGLLIAGYLLIGPALGFAAFSRIRGLSLEVTNLRAGLEQLKQEIAVLRGRLAGVDRNEGSDRAETQPEPQPLVQEADAAVSRSDEEPEDATMPTDTPIPPSPEAPRPDVASSAAGIEQWLTTRGLIWLGGVTLALAGLFLAKYSYEHGWLRMGPGARCFAGFLFGVLLTAGGEWLRRRPLQRAIAAIGPNYLPPALTAAGLASAFASVYAAYGLYDLLPPLVAFALLALVAFSAFGLAILQGPFIAVLALLGGFVTPLLISSPNPSAWGLFAYLLALTAAALGVTRYMACWWLAWGALIGAVLWPLFWFAAFWATGDAAVLGSYLVLLGAAYLALRYRSAEPDEGFWPITPADRIACMGALAVAVLAFILVRMDAYGGVSLAAVFALVVLFLAAAWREPVFECLILLAAGLTLSFFALWHLPQISDWPAFTHNYRGADYGTAMGPVVPPALGAFLIVALLFGAVFAAAGFAALSRARRPQVWAAVSAALPVLLLAVAYWRVTGLGVDLAWSAAALAEALLCFGAAAQIRRRPPRAADERIGRLGADSANDLLLGIYALGCVGALGLAFTMALEQAWLTVALSLLLPAVAWISAELKLRSLRPAAFAIAAVVLVRLVANYNILDYPLGALPGVSWVLYGYGVPALAFWWAARRLRRQADDALVLLLEGGALVLTWLLVTFEIRSLVVGDLGSPSYHLAEQSLQTVAWLAMAYGWLRAYRRSGRAALLWGWRLLAGLAAVHSPLFQLLLSNPLWSGEPVGNWPLVNLLALAYLVPAVFALAFAWELRADGQRKPAMAAAAYALLLIFVYLTLEVRRSFHGPLLDLGPTGDGELLAYSLVWLAYAWGLFGLGVRSGFASLRYASLGILAVATGKVLLFDWGALEGLFRFASFASLGFSLLGIPFLYQRLVLPPRSTSAAASGNEPV